MHPLVTLMAGLLVAAHASAADAVRLTVAPLESLADQAIVIRVESVSPGEEVTLRATSGAGAQSLTSEATYRADAKGVIDVSRDPALRGSYVGVRPMGLFSTLRPGLAASSPPARDGMQELLVPPMAPPVPRPARGATEVRVEALVHGRAVAEATARRRVTGADVIVTEVREGGLVGRLYEPPGTTRPAVMVLGGSNGGIPAMFAPTLAAHGYVTFALAYFREEGLSKDLVEIPLEYVKGGLDWLRARPGIDRERVGILGMSRGGELVLLTAATYPDAVQAVVALSPSHIVWEGAVRDPQKRGIAAIRADRSAWTLKGQPLPYVAKAVTPELEARVAAGQRLVSMELFAPPLADAAAVDRARIPVEAITAPVLLVSGGADQTWPSVPMAEEVAARMRRSGRRVEHLTYAAAGHVLPDSWIPVPYGGSIGGTAEAAADAFADYWPRLLAFFEKALPAH